MPMKESQLKMLYQSTCEVYLLLKEAVYQSIMEQNSKNMVLNKGHDPHYMKRLFSNLFHPKATQKLKMYKRFLREHLLNSLHSVI